MNHGAADPNSPAGAEGTPVVQHLTELSDTELVARARADDREAFAELWRRHARAGLTVARSFTSTFEADDLVSEAYAKIYAAITAGGGPTAAFRPYLFTTIRNVASSWGRGRREDPIDTAETIEDPRFGETGTMAALDRSLASQAFRSLPTRWQEVLWYCEVEAMQPQDVAPLLGMTPNAVAALAYRAREGLRQAWIQAHLASVDADSECAWTTERLGSYARDGLGKRDTARLEKHLGECARCAVVASEAHEVGSRLALVLLPLTIGVGAATAYAAWTQTGANSVSYALGAAGAALPAAATAPGTPATATGAGETSIAASGSAAGAGAGAATTPVTALIVTGALVAASVVAVVFGVPLVSRFFPPTSGTVSAHSADDPVPGVPTPAPEPFGSPAPATPAPTTGPLGADPDTDAPVASPLDPVTVPTAPDGSPAVPPTAPGGATTPSPSPSTPPTSPPDPPVLPAAPTIASVDTGPPEFAGRLAPIVSGTAEPGATVEIFDHGTLQATTTADAAGAWRTPQLLGVASGYAISARQTDGSGAMSPLAGTVTGDLEAVQVTATGILLTTVSVQGVPGAPVVIMADGIALDVVTLDEAGGATATFLLVALGDHRIGAAYVGGPSYTDGDRRGLLTQVPLPLG